MLRAYPLAHLEADGLGFRYEGRRERALSGVDLRVGEGETVLLPGPSGSGKSTLALCLNGLIPHALGGRMGAPCAPATSTPAPPGRLAQDVGLVFQDPESQVVAGKIEDEVAFGLENLGVAAGEMDGRVDEALSEVGMGAWAAGGHALRRPEAAGARPPPFPVPRQFALPESGGVRGRDDADCGVIPRRQIEHNRRLGGRGRYTAGPRHPLERRPSTLPSAPRGFRSIRSRK